MYIIYNEDGSIKAKNLNEFIQQGNSYVNFIEVYRENWEPEDYSLIAHFELANGTKENVSTSEEVSREIDGIIYYGRAISLSKLETALSGPLKMNLQIVDNETERVLTTYTVYLSINSGVDPGEIAFMSQEEYQNLLEQLQEVSGGSVSKEYVDEQDANIRTEIGELSDSVVDRFRIAENHRNQISGRLEGHIYNMNNPHTVNKAQVGLGSVVNTGDSDIPVENGTQKFTTGGAYRMQQAIDNLSSAGRFLSLWDATTGEALSDPPTTPIYQYQSGDYFRVSVGGNRIPTGSQYDTEGTNYETSATPVVLGDVFYYDGQHWVLQNGSGAGSVLDVRFLGNSVVVTGIAEITKQLVLDAIYPIGSIYMSVEQDETTKDIVGKYGCKLANLGGTWERLEDRFLVGASSTYIVNSTGGEATHTLTIDEMPIHTHTQQSHNHTQNAHYHRVATLKSGYSANNVNLYNNANAKAIGGLENDASVQYVRYAREGTSSVGSQLIQSTTATNQAATAVNNNTGGGQAHNNLPPYLAVYMWKRTA